MEKKQVLNHDVVTNYSEWEKGNMNRCYLTLAGKNKSWRGDRETKVYWDNNTNELVIQRGKGLTSGDFENSLKALQAIEDDAEDAVDLFDGDDTEVESVEDVDLEGLVNLFAEEDDFEYNGI